MSAEDPPTFYFSNMTFNPAFYNTEATPGYSKGQSDSRFLIKVINDTTNYSQTFSNGLTINNPIQINYANVLVPTSFNQLGYTQSVDSGPSLIMIISNAPNANLNIGLTYIGVYLINYEYSFTMTGAGTSGIISSIELGMTLNPPPTLPLTLLTGLNNKNNVPSIVTLPSTTVYSNSGIYKCTSPSTTLYFIANVIFDKTLGVRYKMNVTRIG
jgi:hypothetical protein